MEDKNTPRVDQLSVETSDWFSTIPSTRDRLYNPRLETHFSQEVWRKLPELIEGEKELLKTLAGSKELSVHLHGSNQLGLGTNEDTSPSDIDLVIFTGPKDEYEERYQQQHADKSDRLLPEEFRDSDIRTLRFMNQSHIGESLKSKVDGMLFRIPRLKDQVEQLCLKLDAGKKPNTGDVMTSYQVMLLFASEPIYETDKDLTAKFRNQLLKVILNTPGGQIFWDEGIREQFNYFLVNYEENSIPNFPEVQEKHRKRVQKAFDETLIHIKDPAKHQRAENFLRSRRSSIHLPTYRDLGAIKTQVDTTV